MAGAPGNPAPVTPGIPAFGAPDGLWFDGAGSLWIQTDGTQPVACNNQMLCADTTTGEVKRFLVGPVGCEVTGITQTPDGTATFVGIQHPGEGGGSDWPDKIGGPAAIEHHRDPASRRRPGRRSIRLTARLVRADRVGLGRVVPCRVG